MQNVWKIGTHWGKYGPSNFDLFLNYQCAFFGLDDAERIGDWQKAEIGDLLLVCDGYKPVAIGIMQSKFENYQQGSIRFCKSDEEKWIDGSDNVRICKARFCLIPDGETAAWGNDSMKRFCAHSNKGIVISKWNEYNNEGQNGTKLYTCEQLANGPEGSNTGNEIAGKILPIEIPPVQRGLVWNPEQVGTLWDSILRDMPIGSFMAYHHGNGPLQLLDGQQRYNAIRTGINPTKSDGFRIWVGCEEGSDNLFFMVCSESHPWGYNKDHRKFGAEERSGFNKVLRGEDESFSDEFTMASLEQAYPMLSVSTGTIFVPLAYALKGKYEEWGREPNIFRTPKEIVNLLDGKNENDIKKAFSKVRDILANKNVLKYEIPIHVIRNDINDDNERIATLFSRINMQGTPLSLEDARYSSLCVLMGKELKDRIEELSKQFMPPARLAHWAVRLYLLMYVKEPKEENRREVLRNASDADFRNVIAHHSDNFKTFCEGTDGLIKFVNIVKKVYNSGEDSVPQLVYLENRDDNWITMIAYMVHHFSDLFKWDAHWFPLLGMLPEVICSRQDCAHLFIKAFYNAVYSLKEAKTSCSCLGKLISIACASAALDPNAFVHMYPNTKNGISDDAKQEIIGQWWNWNALSQYNARPFIPYTHNMHILYYAQRRYLAKILPEGVFKPEKKEMWGQDNNKPFDVDHIIPRDNWPNEWMMDQLANKQLLYYRHNRMKGAYYEGISDALGYSTKDINEWFVYPQHDLYTMDGINEGAKVPLYKEKTVHRWLHLITKVYSDLHIDELMQSINSLPELTSDEIHQLPGNLQAAIRRYKYMHAESCKNPELVWGCLAYRGLTRNNIIGMMKMGKVDDFAHSLVEWLSLGKEADVNGVPVFDCITMGLNGKVEKGIRRGFGVSPYVDPEQFNKWNEIPRSCDDLCKEWWISCTVTPLDSSDSV